MVFFVELFIVAYSNLPYFTENHPLEYVWSTESASYSKRVRPNNNRKNIIVTIAHFFGFVKHLSNFFLMYMRISFFGISEHSLLFCALICIIRSYYRTLSYNIASSFCKSLLIFPYNKCIIVISTKKEG